MSSIPIYNCSLEDYCIARGLKLEDFEQHNITSYYRGGMGSFEKCLKFDAEREGYSAIFNVVKIGGAVPRLRGIAIKPIIFRKGEAEILD